MAQVLEGEPGAVGLAVVEHDLLEHGARQVLVPLLLAGDGIGDPDLVGIVAE